MKSLLVLCGVVGALADASDCQIDEATMLQVLNTVHQQRTIEEFEDEGGHSRVAADAPNHMEGLGFAPGYRGPCRTANGHTAEGENADAAHVVGCAWECIASPNCQAFEWSRSGQPTVKTCKLYNSLMPGPGGEVENGYGLQLCYNVDAAAGAAAGAAAEAAALAEVTCSVEAETSSQENAATSTGASLQFSVDGVWSPPHVIAESMSLGEVLTVEETLPGQPEAVKILAGGLDGWGYKRLVLTCGGETWVLLDSENGEPFESINSRYWVDTHNFNRFVHRASQVYRIPVLCSVEAETSSQTDAETATGASVQFSVDDEWSTPRVLATSMSSGEVVTTEETLPGLPEVIRILAAGDDAWGYKRLSVSCGNQTWVLLDNENGEPVNSASQEYWIPVRCSVEAETSSQPDAETATGASVQFSVNGEWSTPRVIATSMSLGEVVTTQETLPRVPEGIRILAAGHDAWGFKRISVSCGDVTWGLRDSENGKPFGDNGFWVETGNAFSDDHSRPVTGIDWIIQ